MSSGVENSDGLSVEQWVYLALPFAGTVAEQTVSPDPTSQGWRILKVSLFAGTGPATLRGDFTLGTLINLAGGGCVVLEPKAYNRPFDKLLFAGDGSLLIVEFIYKAIVAGTNPNVTAV